MNASNEIYIYHLLRYLMSLPIVAHEVKFTACYYKIGQTELVEGLIHFIRTLSESKTWTQYMS